MLIILRLVLCFVTPGPRCIKLFAGVFYGKNQETPAKKKIIHCNLHRDLPEFFMANKKSGKKFYATGPRCKAVRSGGGGGAGGAVAPPPPPRNFRSKKKKYTQILYFQIVLSV